MVENQSRRGCIKLAGAAAVGLSGLAGCSSNNSNSFEMSTMNTGTSWYVLGGAIGEHLSDYLPGGDSVDVLPVGGGLGVIDLLRDGEVDFGLGYPYSNQWAYEGSVLFDNEYNDLRSLVGYLDTFWLTVGVDEDVPVESFEEIAEEEYGLDLAIGPASGANPAGIEQSFEAHGIALDDLEDWGGSVTRLEHDDMVSELQSGNVEAVSHASSPGHPTWTEMGESVDMHFLQYSDDAKDELTEYGWADVGVMPEGLFGSPVDVETMGTRTSMCADASLDDEVAYAITQCIYEEIDAITNAYEAAEVFDPEGAASDEFLGVPLHPGSEEYMEENGYI